MHGGIWFVLLKYEHKTNLGIIIENITKKIIILIIENIDYKVVHN